VIETVIDCIDCGGRCYVVQPWPDDDPPVAGDIVTYRCAECGDRWDLVVPEDDVGIGCSAAGDAPQHPSES
jgi:predicted nucleic acid-binding Zn ribbon protein